MFSIPKIEHGDQLAALVDLALTRSEEHAKRSNGGDDYRDEAIEHAHFAAEALEADGLPRHVRMEAEARIDMIVRHLLARMKGTQK